MKTIRWGIVGAGNIASKFAESLTQLENSKLVAVSARSRKSAESFGERFNINKNRCYTSNRDLVSSDDIDIVYIATPNHLHYELSMLSLNHDKAVLCEKPSMLNQKELEDVLSLAKSKNLFFMEAMKNRFMPSFLKVKEIIDKGLIGKIKFIDSNFGFHLPYDPGSYLFDKEKGGGALLDVGVYSLSLSLYLLDIEDVDIASTLIKANSGVDESVSIRLSHQHSISHIYSSIAHPTTRVAIISGTKGFIRIPHFSSAQSFTLTVGEKIENYEFPFEINGMEYQIKEAENCLRDGLLESKIMPWSDSLKIMEMVDEVMEQNYL